MVTGGISDAYQCIGALGSDFGSEELCQEDKKYKHSGKNQQQHSNGVYQPLRRHTFQRAEQSSSKPLGVGHGEEYFFECRTSPRIKNIVADEEPRAVRDHHDWMIHPRIFPCLKEKLAGSGHVCLMTNMPIAMFLQLEARPISGDNRCICTLLERFLGDMPTPLGAYY